MFFFLSTIYRPKFLKANSFSQSKCSDGKLYAETIKNNGDQSWFGIYELHSIDRKLFTHLKMFMYYFHNII